MMTKPRGCQDTPFHRVVELHFPIRSRVEVMALIAISGRSIPYCFRHAWIFSGQLVSEKNTCYHVHSFAVPSFSKKITPRMYINVYNISYLNLLSHTFPWNPESESVPLSKRKIASAPRFPGESDLDLAHFPAYGIATTDHIPDAQVRRSTVNAMITRSSPWWNDEGLPENT